MFLSGVMSRRPDEHLEQLENLMFRFNRFESIFSLIDSFEVEITK